MRGLAWLLLFALIGGGLASTIGVMPVQAALPPLIPPPPPPPPPPPIDPLPDPDPIPPPPPPPINQHPEPASLTLLVVGAGIVGIRVLRRKKAQS
jgi:hypothetical protein